MILRITNFGFIFLAGILTGCWSSNEKISDTDRLVYTVSGESFVLDKECLDYLYNDSSDINSRLFIKIKNKTKCSGKLNSLFKKNIKKEVVVSFNNTEVTKATIYTPLKVQNGFYQSVPNKHTALKIMEAYKMTEDDHIF